jgi:hypothetical protein
MTPHDDSDWADLAEELGLEAKPKPKPYSPPADESTQTGFASRGEAADRLEAFPETPWPEDPNPDASGVAPLADLPDASSHDDEQDTLIDPLLANEEYAADDEPAGEGDSDGEPGKKKRRRRRKRRGGGDGEAVDGEAPAAEVPVEPRSMADAIKNLVANWTVPGWNDIVAGLYRPGGDR